VPVSCFLLFLCFRKATQEIFSELDETKAKPPIFTEASQRPKMRWREAHTGHTLGWRGVTTQDFIKFWGKKNFAFVLFEMIEISQGFKNF
jgi:hypothetical protein